MILRWSIKARVVNKSNIRTYSNAKGEGKLFNVELMDQTGEIRANGFNEQVDRFYEMLQIDHVKFSILLYELYVCVFVKYPHHN